MSGEETIKEGVKQHFRKQNERADAMLQAMQSAVKTNKDLHIKIGKLENDKKDLEAILTTLNRMVEELCASFVNPGEVDSSDSVKLVAKENIKLRKALNFYSERAVYEKAGKFSGDNDLIDISHIATEALR